jgi:hypothetical protein
MTVGDALFGDDGTGGIVGASAPDGIPSLPAAVPPPVTLAAEPATSATAPDADPAPQPSPPAPAVWVPPHMPTRPRIVDDEPAILGLTRRSHGRLGLYAFRLFFLAVFAVIVLDMVVVLLGG